MRLKLQLKYWFFYVTNRFIFKFLFIHTVSNLKNVKNKQNNNLYTVFRNSNI